MELTVEIEPLLTSTSNNSEHAIRAAILSGFSFVAAQPALAFLEQLQKIAHQYHTTANHSQAGSFYLQFPGCFAIGVAIQYSAGPLVVRTHPNCVLLGTSKAYMQCLRIWGISCGGYGGSRIPGSFTLQKILTTNQFSGPQ